MIDRIKAFITKSKTKMLALLTGVAGGSLVLGSSASAAMDPDVASTTGTVVDTMTENITGVITENISQIVIVGVIIFSITFAWKLFRRFVK
jgi:hypothetical protein